MRDPLRHHGDAEVRADGTGLLDLAVNVYPGPPPGWLLAAMRDSLADVGAYPDPTRARAAVARHHQRPADEVLLTAGAAEAFSLVARLHRWRRPVVVHPQFTEPHAALVAAGHDVTAVVLPGTGFRLADAAVPEDADLVVVGNPTNPTGVLHDAETIRALARPGRLVVVDEAFMDTVPGERGSFASSRDAGVVVIRSLTKHWGIPGVRVGHVLGPAAVVAALQEHQVPWSVSAAAAAAALACCGPHAAGEAARRTADLVAWRDHLQRGLAGLGVGHVPSSTSFVLARVGPGVHGSLRRAGIAVRRADTFPGLDGGWVRIAARPAAVVDRLLGALAQQRTRTTEELMS